MTAKAYLGDIIGGSIMLRESRIISELLLQLPKVVYAGGDTFAF